MTQKPSIRIEEIYPEINDKWHSPNKSIKAILQYLDEEHERNRCSRGEHKLSATKEGIECGLCHVFIGDRSRGL